MSKRFLSWFFVLAMLVGGAAACGDDSGDGGGSDTTTGSGDSGDSGDSGSDSGNPDVQAYCDQVTQFADDVVAAEGDLSALADLSSQGQELSQAATDLSANAAVLTSADSDALAQCSQQAADALAGLAG